MKKNQNKKTYYSIVRKNSGYVVINDKGEEVAPENPWAIAIVKLEQILRKEIGL